MHVHNYTMHIIFKSKQLLVCPKRRLDFLQNQVINEMPV